MASARLIFYSEATAYQGNIDGHAKVFLHDANIIATDQKFISLKHFFYEIIIAFSNWYLKNEDTKNVAAKIPFHSRNGKFNIDSSDAFWNAVENKFDALQPEIEHSQELAP